MHPIAIQLHDTTPAPAGDAANASSTPRRIARFAGHYLEMVIAMIVGMVVLGIPVDAIAQRAGVADLYHALPLVGALVMTAIMVVPMALWMRFRGHDARMIGEMSAAMVAPTVVVVAAGTLGLIEAGTVMRVVDPLMYASMLVAMVARWPMYSGGH